MKLLFLVFTLISTQAFSKVLPIAHRGAAAYTPENTKSSILKAMELGSKYIEIDVHMTKDGKVVAIHDATIDRTSNGKGKVFDYTYKELKKFDYGSWFDPKFKGENLPTLTDVLAITRTKSIVIIEVKYGAEQYPQIEEKIIKTVKQLGLSKNVILKSFSYQILNRFEKLAPNIERLYCTFWGNDYLTIDNFLRLSGIFENASFNYLQVHKYFLSKSLIEKAHKKGIKVVVWDVHDKESMREFVEMGVDFIETDNPDYVLSL